ncbi:hypothetical protein SLA_6879 [Streptomyces laurentii]|uniref:Secreted protein n=1 Tax=Streptomyces laurentii TaxID=39478 RepID=A0A160P8Y5_STRLU|nr:hypothetical protein SLA_6879 [Streptomyces laurentii]
MNVYKKAAGLLAAAGAVIVSLLATAAPAQAYGSELNAMYESVDTSTCPCTLYDQIDNTYFAKDSGGLAVKAQLWTRNGDVAKVEFHPYDQKLWIYDAANDGDTVYVTLYTARKGWSAIYYAPGTSKDVDKNVIDFSSWLNEGEDVLVRISDNSDGTDVIATAWGRA